MWIIVLAIIVLLIALAVGVIYHDTHNFAVKEYEISTDKLDRDYVYVFLTDLHGYVYGKGSERLIEAVDKISPDAVFCAGDMLTAAKGHRNVEIDSGLRLLEELASRYPVYVSNGNHEEKIKIFVMVKVLLLAMWWILLICSLNGRLQSIWIILIF